MRIPTPVLLAIPAMLVGIGVTEFAAVGQPGAATLIGEGFKPGVCAIEPPAELLALADWPLDSAGCASGKPRLPKVVEARIRSVADILAGSPRGGNALADAHHTPAPVVTAKIVPIERIPGGPVAVTVAAAPEAEGIDDQQAGPLPTLTRSPSAGDSDAGLDILAKGHSLKPKRLQQVDARSQYGDLGATPSRDAGARNHSVPPALFAAAAVDPSRLDELRGGFDLGDIQVKIGIEQVVMINGVLQSTTVLRLAEIGNTIAEAQARVTTTLAEAQARLNTTLAEAQARIAEIQAPASGGASAPSVPSAAAPASTPSAAVATSTPSVAAPASTPSAAVAASTPSVAAPASTPSAAAPASTPSAAVAASTPSAAVAASTPSAAVAASTPSAAVTASTPSVAVAASTPGVALPAPAPSAVLPVAAALPVGAALAIIQNGPNNSVSTALNGASLATIIQNSLDNQHVQVITKVDAAVNSAEIMQGLRLNQALDEALTRAMMAR